MIRAGIVGGTGYTGVELIGILAGHPDVELSCVTSRAEEGVRVDAHFPSLRGFCDLAFEDPAKSDLGSCDVVFFATPNGVAMKQAPALIDAGVAVIDLSADFRIDDIKLWESVYGMTHSCPELVADAAYGLPEINRDAIAKARLIANPGCYPTTVQLGFAPLLENDVVDQSRLIADSKSGISGAGRNANVGLLLSENAESFKAYGVPGHRHQPEIRQGLERMTDSPIGLTFVPHLVPMIRGIHSTLYAELKDPDTDVQKMFEDRFANEPFVDVLPWESHPETRSVRGTNMCQMACHRPMGGNTVVVLSVEDNLVKGAAGQAVQNMNVVFNFDETAGLVRPATFP